ncbi:MAG: hypothetical protein LBL82_01135 [Oscillospiraceae bacterium]|jgi:hypothetical protein|nr:hypothetical protein [Oscillospiraceae bacterium]
MNNNIPVICLVNRSWDVLTQSFNGTEKSGTIIDIVTRINGNCIEASGVIAFDDNSFDIVPIEYITKNDSTE